MKHCCTPGFHRMILLCFFFKRSRMGDASSASWLLLNHFRGISIQGVAFWMRPACGLPQRAGAQGECAWTDTSSAGSVAQIKVGGNVAASVWVRAYAKH